MEARRPGLSARAMAAVMAWIESRPLPRELFGDLARWLPGTILVVGVAVTLVLLYGVAIVASVWATNGRPGAALTFGAALLLLVLAHGRYALVVDDRSPPATGGGS